MTPKSDGLAVTSLKLWVDEDDWIIRKAELIEFSGKKTLYTINDLKANTGLEIGLFSFTPPEGAEVVDLR
jgi:outer membrane lipoprotein-sorting protein